MARYDGPDNSVLHRSDTALVYRNLALLLKKLGLKTALHVAVPSFIQRPKVFRNDKK